MRALARAVVEPGGRLAHLASGPPITLRRVRSDDASTCALCLVGTAAGPLAGDELELELTVRDGARATLQAAGASIAQGAGGARCMHARVTVGAGATLVADPGALVVAHGSRVDVHVTIELAADAHVEWRELIVLGRSGEPPGAATLRWDVTSAGRPVLRQLLDLADPQLASWHGTVAGARVLATTFVHDPARKVETVVRSATAVTARLGEHTRLTTVLAADAVTARREHDALRR